MKMQRLKDGRLRDAGTGRVLKDAGYPPGMQLFRSQPALREIAKKSPDNKLISEIKKMFAKFSKLADDMDSGNAVKEKNAISEVKKMINFLSPYSKDKDISMDIKESVNFLKKFIRESESLMKMSGRMSDAMSPEERKKKFAFVKSKIHPDYKGASGILVNEGGRGTVLVNEKTIKEDMLNKLYKQYGGKLIGDAQEYYNWPRVEAVLKSEMDGKTYKQEINFPTRPYSSESEAKKATQSDILRWIKENGNRKYNDILKLVSFRRK